jgi:hypothetical protein
LRVFVGEGKSVACEFDGGGDDFVEGELAVLFFGIDEAGNGAGDADGAVSDNARIFVGVGENVALGVEIHIFGGSGGSLFAKVDEVSFAVGEAEEHEAAAAEISGLGMNDGEGETGGHGGVNGVAAGVEHLDSGTRGKFVDAGDERVRSVSGAQGSRGRCDGQQNNRNKNCENTTLDAHELGEI